MTRRARPTARCARRALRARARIFLQEHEKIAAF
jgi:hypothetical protein